MKLIAEHINDVEYIVEEKGKKDMKIRGIFMQAETKNRNGRLYPKEVLMKEVSRYNKEFINQGRAFGELGHPEGPTVNLDRVSHMITRLEPDGNNFIGEAKLLSTPIILFLFSISLKVRWYPTNPVQPVIKILFILKYVYF